MSILLTTEARTVTIRSRRAVRAITNSCPPDCSYEFLCDSSHRYYRRQCCYRTDCSYFCGSWVLIGSC
jgi:hypothetical protein